MLKTEWLTVRCDSLAPVDIRLQEMSGLKISEDRKRQLLETSKSFHFWVDKKWKPFLAKVQDGDEVWRFRTPASSWPKKLSAASYCIVRDGVVVHSLVMMRS
ncbi:MAG: hypothetical protein KDA69_06745 [Planctomycetaceae bacterium]|nr:hypothetical protein [Planctomycetaceae bacterium]MCA9043998.1 hypothetical protein [Planctomycetaceae bacterium]MCB9951773.1 hypothetical protein [Planctomycetaceae bacterium]